jgi:hypothetical protein
MRRKISFFLLLVAFTLAAFPMTAESAYYGSSKSNKYHYRSCRWAHKIHAFNLVVFKDKTEAKKAGYIPCKVCNP